jgi:hypothetical protein
VAEFRLSADGTASLTILEPGCGHLAQTWFDRGVEILGEARYVKPEDGANFMRALLQRFNMSYTFLSGESDRA